MRSLGLLMLVACRAGDIPDDGEPINKAVPASLSNADAWTLFDRSIATGFAPTTAPIHAVLDRSSQLTAIKVFGPAPYLLRVRSGEGHGLGFEPIDLRSASPGWHVYPSKALVSTSSVELTFEQVGSVAGTVPELELWTVADDTADAPVTAAVADLPSHLVALIPDTRSADLLPGEGADSPTGDCATFTVTLSRSPTTFRSVHLVYTAEGIAGPFALIRTVNGIGRHGGTWLPATNAVTFSDEFDSSLLQLGTNTVQLCVPRDASRGVALTDVRVVGELDIGARTVADVERESGDSTARIVALTDNDAATTAELAAGDRLHVRLERLIAPDALVFRGRINLAAITDVECTGIAGEPVSVPILARRAVERDEAALMLDGGARACRTLSVRFDAASVVDAVDVVGSSAGDRVDWPHVVVTSGIEHFGDRAWLGGFVARPPTMRTAIRLDVAGEAASGLTGDFGRMLERSAGLGDAWPVAVKATFPDGTSELAQRVLSRDARSRIAATDKAGAAGAASTANVVSSPAAQRAAFGDDGDSVVVRTKPLEAAKIRLGSRVGLDVPVGALRTPANITVRHLGTDIVPPLDPGMINVTAPRNRGYEFLPHGTTFRRAVEVVVPFDETALPEGMTHEDIHTYFFDPAARRWKRLDRVAIDVGEKVTRSRTDHFTIMINAVLTTPKNPTPLSFDPTMLSSIAAASPAANIAMIQPPQASSRGDANVSLPLDLPRGRGAYSPQLALAYNSGGGNGWVGVGWDLSLSGSRVEIDTRWGVPDYSRPEVHRYLLDGAALVPTLDGDGPGCITAETAQRFHPRVEGAFSHILRCGDDATSYHWELRDRNGTLFIYGALPGEMSAASLRAPPLDESIYRWSLRRVLDVHGNTTELAYELDVTTEAEAGRDSYLARIDYTSTATLPAAYSVRIRRDDGTRADRIISGRAGFKMSTEHLLRAVDVYFGDEVIRSYVLEYAHGQFGKTVLHKIAVYGAGGCAASAAAYEPAGCAGAALFHEHTLDYLEDETGFGNATSWELSGPGSTAATLVQGKSVAYSGSVSYGFTEEISGSVNLSRTTRDEEIGLYDVNGDGLVDQLFADGRVLYNQWHPTLTASGNLFTSEGPAIVGGFPAAPHDITWAAGVKVAAGFKAEGWGASASAGFDTSVTRATQLITDVNGDGFIDVVFTEDSDGHAGDTAELGRPCAGGMCFSTKTLQRADLSNDPALQQAVDDAAARLYVADPVVRWVAPYSGTVALSGSARKAAAGGTDGVTLELHVGGTLAESLAIGATDTEMHAFPSPQTIDVEAGDTVYLRLQTGNDEGIRGSELADKVHANLVARYQSACTVVDFFGIPVPLCSPVMDPEAERDPTGAPVFEYDTERDLRISNRVAPLLVPVSGVLQMSAQLVKQPAAAHLRICVQRFSAPDAATFSRTLDEPCDAVGGSATNVSGTTEISAGTATTLPINSSFPVQRGQRIVVRVESDLSFDPADVVLEPAIAGSVFARYLSVCPILDDGTEGSCTQDAAAIDEVPIGREAFGLSVFPASAALGHVFVAPSGGFFTASPLPNLIGGYIYAIRSDRDGLIAYFDCRTVSCNANGQVFFAASGDSITFELVTSSGSGPQTLTVADQGGGMYTAPISRRSYAEPATEPSLFVGGYRSLSATMWNETVPFAPELATADYESFALLTVQRQTELSQTALPPLAVATSPFAGESAWAGPLSAAFVSAGELHAARIGMVLESASEADRGGLFAGRYARQSLTRSLFIGASAELKSIPAGSLGLQATFSESKTTGDILDLDGDGIADQIGGASVGFGIAGTLLSTPFTFEGGFRKRTGHEYTFNFGASAAKRRTTAGGRDRSLEIDGEPDGIFGGVGYAVSRVQMEEDLNDVNGDGLPDHVRRSGSDIYVRYNLGRRFGAEEHFAQIPSSMREPIDRFETSVEAIPLMGSTDDALGHDTSVSTSSSAGLNVEIPVIADFSANRTKSSTTTRTTRQLSDLNGDGLPDLLFKRSDEGDSVFGVIHVQFNTGSGFTAPFPWRTTKWSQNLLPQDDGVLGEMGITGADVLTMTSTESVTYSASGSVLGIGGGAGRTSTKDRFDLGFIDIDGDGAPDHVLRTKRDRDDIMRVKHNRATGRANLLSKIHGPLGGTITLDYSRTVNSVELPQSRQVLTSVIVDDGVNLDGDDVAGPFASPSVVTTFAYDGGFQHRYEKEFFGFATVTTRRADGVTVTDEYENRADKYALRGTLRRQTSRDGNGGVLAIKQLHYDVRAVLDESNQPVAVVPSCQSELHPLLADEPTACVPQHVLVVREDTTHAEGGTLAKTHTSRDTSHDRFGNILTSIDEGDAAIGSDDVHASATYRTDTSRWILGRVTELEVRGGGSAGPLLRRRTGTYDTRGQLVSMSVDTGSAAGIATSTLTYDAMGNLVRLTTPPNATNQTQSFEVEYDTTTGTYPVRTRDAFGLTSTAAYDLRFGVAIRETDTNGVSVSRTIDGFGRLATVRGPYDTGPLPAISVQYLLGDDAQPRARTITTSRTSPPPGYTGAVAAPMSAVVYVDGLGRPLVARKTAVVGGSLGMTTTGLVQRDALGREFRVYQPFHTAGSGSDASLIVPLSALPLSTRTDFDAHDRPLAVTYPDNAVDATSYALEAAPLPGAPLLLVTKSLAANGNRRESYTDQLGRIRAFVEHPTRHGAPTPATAISQYDYLATGELGSIVDAEGNVTTLGYDLRGLRTTFQNPDTGLIEERFDAMGNRIALVEPNHRAANSEVRFEFVRDRLVRIDYPSKPDVTMAYGDVGAPYFGAGRVVRVDDESGSQSHRHGALGEVVRTVRCVSSSTSSCTQPLGAGNTPLVFATEFEVDSFGRQLSVRYPDGVTVTSAYDAAGNLSQVAGKGTGWSRIYASQLEYDVYGNRTKLRSGNDVVTTWQYEPARVRLAAVDTVLPGSAGPIQALRYEYDPSSNPTKIRNALPILGGGSAQLPGSSTIDYVYDGVDRLESATGTGQLSAQKSTTYVQAHSYSASHNLVTKSRSHLISQPSLIPTAPGATNFASDYIYESGRPHLPSRIGDLLITYDPSGNPLERRTATNNTVQTLTWDDDGRLVDFQGGGVHQRNTYDASGLRVRRKSTQSETVFASALYDVESGTQGVRHVFAGELRVASELGRFVSGENPVAPNKAGTAYFFHGDHIGSTTVLTNDDGAVHQSLEYFPDGEAWIDRGPTKPVNKYLFSGKPYDPDTGFFDFGQRFYEPRTGLWLGVDPALAEDPAARIVKNPSRLAPLAFVAGNPLSNVDPDGRDIVVRTDNARRVEQVRSAIQEVVGKDATVVAQPTKGGPGWGVSLRLVQSEKQRENAGEGTKLVASLINSDRLVVIDNVDPRTARPNSGDRGADAGVHENFGGTLNASSRGAKGQGGAGTINRKPDDSRFFKWWDGDKVRLIDAVIAVDYSRASDTLPGELGGTVPQTPATVTGHELFHATQGWVDPADKPAQAERERQARRFENKYLRSSIGARDVE